MEVAAREYYVHLKESGSSIGKHYLALMQKLNPLRIACAGGKVPLNDDSTQEHADEDSDDDDVPKNQKKKTQKYSDFAFTSKFFTLVKELKNSIRADKTGMVL